MNGEWGAETLSSLSITIVKFLILHPASQHIFLELKRENRITFQMLYIPNIGEDKCSAGTVYKTIVDGIEFNSLSTIVGSSKRIFPRKGNQYLCPFQNDIFNWHL